MVEWCMAGRKALNTNCRMVNDMHKKKKTAMREPTNHASVSSAYTWVLHKICPILYDMPSMMPGFVSEQYNFDVYSSTAPMDSQNGNSCVWQMIKWHYYEKKNYLWQPKRITKCISNDILPICRGWKCTLSTRRKSRNDDGWKVSWGATTESHASDKSIHI